MKCSSMENVAPEKVVVETCNSKVEVAILLVAVETYDSKVVKVKWWRQFVVVRWWWRWGWWRGRLVVIR